MTLISLSELARSFISLWTLVLIIAGVYGVILAAVRKCVRFAVYTLFPLLCGYFLWQVLFEIHTNGSDASYICRRLGNMPVTSWLAILSALTLFQAILLIRVLGYGLKSITPASVKLCLDQMPFGVCCYRDSGMVNFCNICMNDLCAAITGAPLLDGNKLYKAVSGGVLRVGSRVWRFTRRDITLDGEMMSELIAVDITVENARTEALERDKAELTRLDRELSEYNLGLDYTVRRQEILQAKVSIHDEMNRLMLSTAAADPDDHEALDSIFALWEQNALLLCMEADKITDSKALSGIEKLAGALKIDLVWQGMIPDTLIEKQRALFFSAASEAISNAAKHAQASVLEISFEDDRDSVICSFTSDGKMPEGEIAFTGGLANLSCFAQKQGASVFVRYDRSFTLSLVCPKRGKNHPNG